MEYLRYMYTKFFEASRFGGTVIRPLFFEFPLDEKCHEDYEHTFLMGDALKISPQLQKGGKDIKSYFPANTSFIDLNNYSNEIQGGHDGKYVDLKSSNDYVNVHLRNGKIFPWQPY